MNLRALGPVFTAVVSVTASTSPVRAELASPGSSPSVLAPAGGGQGVLRVEVRGAKLFYKACADAPCAMSDGDSSVAIPADVVAADMTIEALAIGAGRHVTLAHTGSFWTLLAAAPGALSEARVLWSGSVGLTRGEAGERYGQQLQLSASSDHIVQVLVGDVREDISICGRVSLLSPKVLDPKDLTWKGAKVQRLPLDERKAAAKLEATRVSAPFGDTGHILQGVSASSGIGTPAALTDGDGETTWAENRGGDGRGEFVQFNAPEQVEITSLTLQPRPATKEIKKGAAPQNLFVATASALFSVHLAEDAWAHAGASYEVKFPAPIKTSCLAVVLDDAYGKSADPDLEVTLAEVSAHTEFDGKADAPALVGALAGGGPRARMAAAILARSGDSAYQAVEQNYEALDDAGRTLALGIIDAAPCSKSAPLYVRALDVGRSGEVRHATDRLTRCGREASAALDQAVATGPDKQKVLAAHLLALVAPDQAIGTIAKVIAQAKPEVRADLRAALGQAARSDAAQNAVAGALANAALSPAGTLDLLRAVAPHVKAAPAAPEAAKAFARLAVPSADFRTRYLLLSPAGALAQAGDPGARDFVLRAASADTDAHVRARASEVLGDLPSSLDPLGRALSDGDPRVRDAALASLGRQSDPRGAKVWPSDLARNVGKLLEGDPFTFVRGHAADALLTAPPGDDADAALDHALADGAPQVRARAVEALGKRGAKAYAGDLRDRLDDDGEILDVRMRAARALGRICDAKSTDRLTELALAAGSAQPNSPELVVGASAAAALGRLNPPDLAQRLAPMTRPDAPRLAKEVAQMALKATDRCR